MAQIRDEAALVQRDRATRRRLLEEINADPSDIEVSEQNIGTYVELLKGLESSMLAETVSKARRGSNRALQVACARELASRTG